MSIKKEFMALAIAVCTIFTGCSDKTGGRSSSDEKVQSDTGTAAQENAVNKEDIVITLGLLSEPEDEGLIKAIDDFNDDDNGCRIETKYMVKPL